jgi:hypothetical protein
LPSSAAANDFIGTLTGLVGAEKRKECIMSLKVERVDTWAASLDDSPGKLAGMLSALTTAGVNLEFIHARRAPEKPGSGVIFVTPIKGAAAIRAAQDAGFRKTMYLHTVRVRGEDKSGEGHRIAQALAQEGLNLSALSGASLENKFTAHIALDSETDAARAMQVLRGL